jgi:hypothetical protein
MFWWAHKGSNLGPLPCEGNALPLSYAPGRRRVSGQRGDLRSGRRGCQAGIVSGGFPRLPCNTKCCAADPPPIVFGLAFLIAWVPDLRRTTSRCAASGTRGRCAGTTQEAGRRPSTCLSLDTIFPRPTDLPVVLICRRRQRCAVGQIRSTTSRIPCPIKRDVSRSSRTLGRGERWTRNAQQTTARVADGEVVAS